MSEPPTFRTGLGDSDAEHIRLLGHDLAGELIGQITFGELAYWLITKRRPTEQQRTMFEAVLVALADHGFTPTAIAARVTLLSAPESVQGALAAGLLGGGSRFLGVTEDTACSSTGGSRRSMPFRSTKPGWDAVAARGRHGDEDGRTLRPGTRSPRAQAGRPAHAGAVRPRPRPRLLRTAPRAVRRDRPDPRQRSRQDLAAQRSRGVRRRARRQSVSRSASFAASPCSPAAPACSATSPRRPPIRSPTTST